MDEQIGRVIREHVGLVDVAPTVLDLLGLPALREADGHSLAPLLRGEKGNAYDYEIESFFAAHSYGWAPLRALVRRGYKYVEAPRAELYRLDADPGESHNLADAEARRTSALARRLRALVSGDEVSSTHVEPELAEHRRRLESLGYAAGGAASQESEAIDPKDGIAWIAELEAGRRAYQTGQPQDGIAPLRRLLARNPNNVQALLALAMCYLGSGRPGDAVRIDRRALVLRPDDDLVHFNLANALAASRQQRPGALPEARRHYERALQLNPRFADAYLNYASLLERSDASTEALDLLERARTAGVRDPDLETRLAVLELTKGNVDAAEQAFRRALELHPHDVGPLEAMARISSRRGRFAESAAFYEKLLDVAPSAATARSLGTIRRDRLDDPAGARIAYLRALALTAPGDPERETLRALIDELAQHP